MKPPEEAKHDLLGQWLKIAEEDLGLAEHLLKEDSIYRAAVAFHLQQSVEKNLKALLVHFQIEFAKKHDLGKILDLIALKNPSLAKTLERAVELNPYAVEHRYPGDYPQISKKELEDSLALAKKVREIVLAICPH